MKYYSTNGKSPNVNFEEAVLEGLAPDKGLFFPKSIPSLPADLIKNIESLDDHEIAFQIANSFIEDEIPASVLRGIVKETLNFPIPLVEVEKRIFSLELFHGPTLAFKDVGARFMARVLKFFLEKESKSVTILVATSGDTGSAVASGFYGVEGINVVILYPSKKVSESQEKQLTTWRKNIYAIEVEGTFDDCQRMAKEAFSDSLLKKQYSLTSANSINIARLLPQSFYYFLAYKQLKEKSLPTIISVPCGNLGNLSAGLIAWKMGLPIERFIISSNANDVVPKYLSTGTFHSAPSIMTIANAMDVGNPSNLARLNELFNNNISQMRKIMNAHSFTDNQIRKCIKELYIKTGYVLDPHGACAYMGLTNELKLVKNANGIFLETAHPAKFSEVVITTINEELDIPPALKEVIQKEKKAVPCAPSLDALRVKLDLLLKKI